MVQNEEFFDIGYFPKKNYLESCGQWLIFFSKFRDYRISLTRLHNTKNK